METNVIPLKMGKVKEVTVLSEAIANADKLTRSGQSIPHVAIAGQEILKSDSLARGMLEDWVSQPNRRTLSDFIGSLLDGIGLATIHANKFRKANGVSAARYRSWTEKLSRCAALLAYAHVKNRPLAISRGGYLRAPAALFNNQSTGTVICESFGEFSVQKAELAAQKALGIWEPPSQTMIVRQRYHRIKGVLSELNELCAGKDWFELSGSDRQLIEDALRPVLAMRNAPISYRKRRGPRST